MTENEKNYIIKNITSHSQYPWSYDLMALCKYAYYYYYYYYYYLRL